MKPTTNAFTLIEMLLSIAIGAIVIYAAYAGFRLSAQTIAISKRMSVENRLIQAGIIEAVNDIDTWTSFDNPTDTTDQGLRGAVGGGEFFPGDKDLGPKSQLPFTPFATSWPSSSATNQFSSSNTWAAHDPETWYRGNFAQRMQAEAIVTAADNDSKNPAFFFDPSSLSPFGRYGMFTNLSGSTALGPTNSRTLVRQPHQDSSSGTYGDVNVRYTWRDNQVLNLRQTLGIYGMMDYLPADTQYVFYKGEEIPTWCWSIGNLGWFTWNVPYWQRSSRGRDYIDGALVTKSPWAGSSYKPQTGLATPFPANSKMSEKEILEQTHKNTTRRTEGNDLEPRNQFNARTFYARQLLTDAKPDLWPNIDFTTMRYAYRSQFYDICRVHWTNPMTGESHGIWFNAFGTTFRGARQQRQKSAALARWYMPKAEYDRDPTFYFKYLPVEKTQSPIVLSAIDQLLPNDDTLDSFGVSAP